MKNKQKNLIFVPGILGDSQFFQKQVSFFKDDYRVHTLSYSRWDITPFQVAAHIRELVISQKIDQPIIWGVSYGGLGVLEYSLKYSGQTKAIILGCTNHAFRFRRIIKPVIRFSKPVIRKMPKKKLYRAFFKRVNFEPVSNSFKNLSPQELDSAFEIHYQRALALFSYHKKRELNQINCPCLIYAARKDRLISTSRSFKMHRLIPKSQFLLVETNCHMPHANRPQEINQSVSHFLETAVFASALDRM
ncbi:MAG: alpha/beta hydrolase [Candidatus Pacebacteria bacterium]|nr:alpha/beta hydrolase [Candidatus Paceibacterota bacterium]